MHLGIVYVPPSKGAAVLDPRLEKEATALAKAGIEVSILCPRFDADQPEFEHLLSGVTLYRKAIPESSIFSKVLNSWTLFYPAWRSVIAGFVDDLGVEALQVCDLPMLRTTLSVARSRSIPVVADFFENWPAAIESYRGDRSSLYRAFMSLSRGHFLYRWYERRAVRECERVIVVVPEAMERFRRAGFALEKFVVVSNTEDETTLDVPEIDLCRDEYQLFRDHWVAIYHGNVGAHRGLDTVVRAIPEIIESVPNFLLLVIGANEQWASKLQKMADSLGVEKHVMIRGWTPYETCMEFVVASQVGLVPHNDFEHTQTTIPHKLFQFMLCARPIVASNCRPLHRIVETAGAGCVFRANDHHDCARAIVQLANDPEACRAFGVRGRAAATTEFAWRYDAERLVNMYNEISRVHRWTALRRTVETVDQPGTIVGD